MLHNEEEFNAGLPAGFDGLFEWDYLNAALPGNIQFMDIDANCEIKGNFLWIETKKPGVDVPNGQMYALQAHVRNGHTAVILWGKTAATAERATFMYSNGKVEDRQVSADDMVDFVKRWSAWAKANPYKHRFGRELGVGFSLDDEGQISNLVDQLKCLLKKFGRVTIRYVVRD